MIKVINTNGVSQGTQIINTETGESLSNKITSLSLRFEMDSMVEADITMFGIRTEVAVLPENVNINVDMDTVNELIKVLSKYGYSPQDKDYALQLAKML